jgi:hypothetical protein
MLNDDELEQYLSEFRPRVLRPLAYPQPAKRLWPKWLAVAATLLVCGAMALWYAHGGGSSARLAKPPAFSTNVAMGTDRASAFALTQLALTDEGQFEAHMAMESRKVLPSFTGASTLRVLSRDK